MHKNAESCTDGEWAAFHWLSADILPPGEIESARRDLDPLSFAQEYEGSFESYQGLAYYAWDRKAHASHALPYDSHKPLIICFDFNVSPGAAAVCQEMTLPNGEPGTGVIGELNIPRNSNTPRMCKRLLKDWKDHRGSVLIYGDATGGSRGTAQVAGSDWDLIENHFKGKWSGGFRICVGKANPAERVRVNAVNSPAHEHLGRGPPYG